MALVLIARLVRPALGASYPGPGFVVGVLPNFGAALSLPFVILVFMARILRIEPGSGKLLKCFVIALGATFVGLFIWEVFQTLVWKYPIDPYDIAATGLGVSFSFGAYMLFLRTSNPAKKP